MTSLLAPASSSSDASATMQDGLPEAEPAAWQGQRVVAVSNRLVFPGQTHAGGLAQALHGLFSRFPGAWLGWSGRTVECDRPATSVHSIRGTRYVTIDLQETLFRQYYMQFSNRVLWPLLHSRIDLINYDGEAYTGYMAVNDRFGVALADLVQDDDLIWVHDYHLLPLASLARRRGLGNKLGFFLHTPVPPAGILQLLPGHNALFRSLLDYDLIGVQTPMDAANLIDYLTHEHAVKRIGSDQLSLKDGRQLQVGVHPVGIDCEGVRRLAEADPAQRPAEWSEDGRAMLLGVDRLDYTKGLEQRLGAVERLLESQPELRGRVEMVQIASPSRSEIPEYRALATRMRRQVRRINRHYGCPGWRPIRYLHETRSSAELAVMYRRARVGLVTPMRDGMNLVAKEYVAAQNSLDPGVLVLSCFAGAAFELSGALLVNPYDREACAQAISRALGMPRLERRQRWREMMMALHQHDIHHWSAGFLDALTSRDRKATAGARRRLQRIAPGRSQFGMAFMTRA